MAITKIGNREPVLNLAERSGVFGVWKDETHRLPRQPQSGQWLPDELI
jgi:hypothetical protein